MKTFDYAKVTDPEYFRDGRLDACSDHIYYASEEDMPDGRTDFRESLNGIWKFQRLFLLSLICKVSLLEIECEKR